MEELRISLVSGGQMIGTDEAMTGGVVRIGTGGEMIEGERSVVAVVAIEMKEGSVAIGMTDGVERSAEVDHQGEVTGTGEWTDRMSK